MTNDEGRALAAANKMPGKYSTAVIAITAAVFVGAIFFGFGFILGIDFEEPQTSLVIHDRDSFPEPFKPVIYYRIDADGTLPDVIVTLACVTMSDPPQWVIWDTFGQAFIGYLPPHTWWIDDPRRHGSIITSPYKLKWLLP